MLWTGLILLVTGFAGILFVSRRRFYRRNVAGVEEHNGFGKMLVTTWAEKLIKFVSVFFVLGGVSMSMMSCMADERAALRTKGDAKAPTAAPAMPAAPKK